ncbi:hypothetical protein FGU65_07670 [Methanoculleus sp. FWC-SCC1]|uniref:PKD domain-containing protein n=1 Tax=Methanoculleus frigidifontis TaxID=2584085 RepID=A0ABT8MA29_9EURY|nr:hypothetical protein [Methanoculleus sp. FWC-SCC1]MDN7024764.1 hypothetical protein [Methanoculleus sp. FWC-SCC1]
MKGVVSLSILAFALVLAAGCASPLFSTVVVRDAYCDLDNNFTFTLENTCGSNRSVDYVWTLNDPMGGYLLRQGEGSAVLQPFESRMVTIKTGVPFHEYSFIGAVMHITLCSDGSEIYRYEEQKSPSDWDYSMLPPVRYLVKPKPTTFVFSTSVDRGPNGDFLVAIDNVSYSPQDTSAEMRTSRFYLQIGDAGWWTSRITSSPQNGSAPVFVDSDGDSCISAGDYYIVSRTFAGQDVRFRTGGVYIVLQHTCSPLESGRLRYGECPLPSDG